MMGPSLGLLRRIGKHVASKIGPKAIGRDIKKVVKKPGTPFKAMGKVGNKAVGGIFGRRAMQTRQDFPSRGGVLRKSMEEGD